MHLNGSFSTEMELKQKLDFIYDKAKSGNSFNGIMEAAFNEVTIIAALNRINTNLGAKNTGTDRKTICKYMQMERYEFIKLVQDTVKFYRPKPAKKLCFQNKNGKKKFIGIPTVLDRIIQECLVIILEPIVEAKFYPQSFGYRPYRSIHDAVYQVFHYANCNLKEKPWTVIEGEMNASFYKLNHRVLIKKLWEIGVRDKRVIAIIKAMLKSGYMESDRHHYGEFGNVKSDGLSKLLFNVYFNSFDWSLGRMYQEPKQRTTLIACDRSRLRYNGVIPKYLVRYGDSWVVLTQSNMEAERLLHKLKKYFKHRLKLELSEDKAVITDMRNEAVNFVGFSIKVGKPYTNPSKQMAMCYPNPKKLTRQIKALCSEVKDLKYKSQDYYRAVYVERINAQIIELSEHIKHVLSSKAYHKIDYAVNKCAFKTFKAIYGKENVLKHVIPMSEFHNRPQRHQNRKDASMAINVDGMWIGLTKAYITGSMHLNRPFNQKLTPYTLDGRKLHYDKLKRLQPLTRHALYDHTNLLNYAVRGRTHNLEYYLNREHAFNRDKGKCTCCKNKLNIGHRYCHHINNKLPIEKINKVSNLAWVCKSCYKLIHIKDLPAYINKNMKSKLNKYRNILNKTASFM